MLFNSIYYVCFLPAVVALYWASPRQLRYPLLLGASYFFYMNWVPAYVLLILALTAVNYGFGLALARFRARPLLALAVATDLGVLAYFKYADFFIANARAAGLDFPLATILLPLGISFFTFEFIHYVVDVWRGSPPVRDVILFALFGAFFPTQIAGPIKRYQAFVGQLQQHPRFDPALAEDGVRLILRGLFKKMVLADNLAVKANLGFAHPAALGTGDAWLAVYAFALQIFCDFSGYTDIGRGSAQLFGFRVPENFAAPYLATSLAAFWRTWHMSLSSWLRDYLYIPLGGSRGGRRQTYRNLFLTMTLGGLWHGAAWHFVVWGAYHGLGLLGQRVLADRVPGRQVERSDAAGEETAERPAGRGHLLRAFLGWALTFHFVCLGWVLFRAPDLASAGTFLSRLVWPVAAPPVYQLGSYALVLAVLGGYLLAVGGQARWRALAHLFPRGALVWGNLLAPAGYAVLILWMVVFPADAQRFIYFQF